MKKIVQENNDLSKTIYQLETNALKTEAKTKEEMKRLQESYQKITDFMTSLAEGLALIEVKTADIELQTEEFAKFKEQQGRMNWTSCNVCLKRVAFAHVKEVVCCLIFFNTFSAKIVESTKFKIKNMMTGKHDDSQKRDNNSI